MRQLIGCLVGLVFALPQASAVSPRDELLRLVPDDIGFCVVVQDLRGHAERLQASPFFKQFCSSPLGLVLLQAPEWEKLREGDEFLQQHFQVSWRQLRDEIFGDALVLAYRPPTRKPAEDEQDLILIRARDGQLLARLLAQLNEAQKQSGELRNLETLRHGDTTYYKRELQKETTFYYQRGTVLALSSRAAMIQRVIERDQRKGAKAAATISGQLQQLGLDQALLALWINPRAFEPELELRATEDRPGVEAVPFRTLLRYWKALDGIGLGLSLKEEVRLDVALRGRFEALPEPARRFLKAATEQSAVWRQFPAEPLFAIAGRIDLFALADIIAEFIPDEHRKSIRDGLDRGVGAVLGRDVRTEILPNIGPDWGFCLAAPEKGGSWFPRLLAAVRVRPGGLDNALFSALNSAAMLVVLDHNRKKTDQLRLRTERADQTEVKVLDGNQALPPGCRPSFALKDGFLILSAAPADIHGWKAGGQATDKGEVVLLRASLRAWVGYLQQHGTAFLTATQGKNGKVPEEARQQLDKLLLVLQLFDQVQLSQSHTAELVRFTLTVRLSQSLQR